MVNMPSWSLTMEYFRRGTEDGKQALIEVTIEYFKRGTEDGKHALMESDN